MKTISKIVFLAFLISLASCQKEIEIELPTPENSFVVEGYIENGKFPIVVLTRNSSYFDPVDSTTLQKLFVTEANVYISDGIQTEKLTLSFSNLFTQTWPLLYFVGDTIVGEVGRTYSLKIDIEGHTITGQTTIPAIHTLDSVWWKPEPVADSLGYIWATISDNYSEKNYYRIFTMRKGRDKRFVPLYGSVYDDIYFNGKTLDFSLLRGNDALQDDSAYSDPEFGYYTKNDTVIIRFTSIDQQHYEFWRTAEQEMTAGGNPFSNPIPIRHNVNGAVGVFGGYAAWYDTLIIK